MVIWSHDFSEAASSNYSKNWSQTWLQGIFNDFDEIFIKILILAFGNFQNIYPKTST